VTAVVVTFDSVPQVAPLQPVPESFQLTPLFEGSFCAVEAKPKEFDTLTDAAGGLTETEIGGGGDVIVMVAEPDFVLSAMETALSVTDAGLGAFGGAV
jgi:hypothetical protein